MGWTGHSGPEDASPGGLVLGCLHGSGWTNPKIKPDSNPVTSGLGLVSSHVWGTSRKPRPMAWFLQGRYPHPQPEPRAQAWGRTQNCSLGSGRVVGLQRRRCRGCGERGPMQLLTGMRQELPDAPCDLIAEPGTQGSRMWVPLGWPPSPGLPLVTLVPSRGRWAMAVCSPQEPLLAGGSWLDAGCTGGVGDGWEGPGMDGWVEDS